MSQSRHRSCAKISEMTSARYRVLDKNVGKGAFFKVGAWNLMRKRSKGA